MTVEESINKAVSEGDIKSIRIMMKNSLLVDPSFAEFDEMSMIAGNMPGLYDEHDGRELNRDKSAWNDDYMNKLLVQVVGNFSRERLNHLKEVIRHLRPVAASRQQSASTDGTRTGQRPYGYDDGVSDARGLKIAIGVVAGGVVGGLIAGITGAITGAVILGAVVAVIAKGE